MAASGGRDLSIPHVSANEIEAYDVEKWGALQNFFFKTLKSKPIHNVTIHEEFWWNYQMFDICNMFVNLTCL